MTRTVVISGVGAVTPLGVGAKVTFERWAAAEVGVVDGIAPCSDFDPRERLSTKEIHRTDRCTQLLVTACDEALADAGLDGELPYEPSRVGCVVGTGIGGLASCEMQHDKLRDAGERAVSSLCIPLIMANAPAGLVAMRAGLEGPNFGVVSACAAGAHAIGVAMRLVQMGDAEAVVAGGAESALTPLATAAFRKMGALSRAGISRPFDARRDGFVQAEGAGAVVVEDAEAAARRGARVRGELLSFASTSDAYHLTAPEPQGRGAELAIRTGLRLASLGPHDLDYVNAHGTSTPQNDRSETIALKRALGADAYRIPISSLKSATGHMLGASGCVEAIVTLLALAERTAPPTLGYEQPDDGLDLDYVPTRARRLEGDGRVVGMSNSFGFGGHNAVLCMAVGP